MTNKNHKVKKALNEFLNKFKCQYCKGDIFYFNSGVYNNPAIELIYRCKKCKKVNFLMISDENKNGGEE